MRHRIPLLWFSVSLLILALGAQPGAFVQAADTPHRRTWEQVLASAGVDFIHAIRETAGGDVIYVARMGQQAVAGRLSPEGNVRWETAVSAQTLRLTPDGGLLMLDSPRVGRFTVSLLDGTGQGVRVREVLTLTTQQSFPVLDQTVLELPDGGFLVALDGKDVSALLRLDASGDLRWSRQYGRDVLPRVYILRSDGGGGAYVVAQQRAQGATQPWLVHVDAAGAPDWARTQAGRREGPYRFHTAEVLADGRLLVAGQRLGRHGWLLVLTPRGEVLRERIFGQMTGTNVFGVAGTRDGGVVLAGSTVGSGNWMEFGWTAKLTAALDTEWERVLSESGTSTALHVLQTRDGGYVLAGTIVPFLSPHPAPDAWFIRLNAQGRKE